MSSGRTPALCMAQIRPRSNASASLLAYLVASKFVDGLRFIGCVGGKRKEVSLCPGVAGAWVNTVGESVLPLINPMHEELLAQPFLQIDETCRWYAARKPPLVGVN